MSDSNTSEMEQMEQRREILNKVVRRRSFCVVCDDGVPSHEYGGKYWSKFMAAGGHLHGPFCSRECYWKELYDE